MSDIAQSVGKHAANMPQDVATVQTLLNDNLRKLSNVKPLKVDGIAGPKTLTAIEVFQKQVIKVAKPDAKVDVGGLTWNALLQVGCDPPTENFPYDGITFGLIRQLATPIKMYSQRFNVPPIAVAGSIADEYNTRRGIRVPLNWIQDNIWVNFATNLEFERDAKWGSSRKLFNLTKHDVGLANVKVETAHQIYDEYRHTFSRYDLDYEDIVDYIRTDNGTVHVATLVIKKAAQELKPFSQGMSEEKAEGLYVTYYKQGPAYVSRFRSARALDPLRRIEPGEGCRVVLQRKALQRALGIKSR
jgi:hypothetical protein